jgi:hypothetical protein
MSKDLRNNLQKFASTIRGSIFYVQEGHCGIEAEKLTLLEKSYVDATIHDESITDSQCLFFTKDYP